jgi:hypothetical protein
MTECDSMTIYIKNARNKIIFYLEGNGDFEQYAIIFRFLIMGLEKRQWTQVGFEEALEGEV